MITKEATVPISMQDNVYDTVDHFLKVLSKTFLNDMIKNNVVIGNLLNK